MKKIVTLIISIIVVTMIGCDVVDRPFDRDRFDKEGYAYVEKYSKMIWSKTLDSIVNSPHTHERVNDLKNKYGNFIININYMLVKNSSPLDYDIVWQKYGDYESIIGSERTDICSDVIERIPESIIEMYIWEVESEEYLQIYYLRKDKELITFDYCYYPDVWLDLE